MEADETACMDRAGAELSNRTALKASPLLLSTVCRPARCQCSRRDPGCASAGRRGGEHLVLPIHLLLASRGLSSGGTDIYPHHLQLCIQSVQLHKVFLVDDLTSRFQPPVVQFPVLHPAGHTCGRQSSDLARHRDPEPLVSGITLTVDGELAVCVKNQLLDVPLFGLFQRSAGSLAHTQDHTWWFWFEQAAAGDEENNPVVSGLFRNLCLVLSFCRASGLRHIDSSEPAHYIWS